MLRKLRLSQKMVFLKKKCYICKKYKLKVKGKHKFQITISTLNATETIKAAFMSKNQELHYNIKDLDLISKEFKYHCLATRTLLVVTVQNLGQTLQLTPQNRLMRKLSLVKEHLIPKI